MCPSWRRDVCRGECRAQSAPGRDAEHVYAVIVRCVLAPTDYDDLAADKSRRVSATWWWKVAMNLGMRPLHRVSNMQNSQSVIGRLKTVYGAHTHRY